MSEKRPYDSTVARIAGNIAAGLIGGQYCQGSGGALNTQEVVSVSVDLARRIVAALTPPPDGRDTPARRGSLQGRNLPRRACSQERPPSAPGCLAFPRCGGLPSRACIAGGPAA